MTDQQSLTLLVVDDEPAWVGALGAVLGKAGHRIVAAYDGEEALRRFRSEPVDVVLLDLAMPRLDGAEVVRIMRAESDTPIIVVSGERDRTVPADLLDMGADDYVRKGVPSTELLARIRAVVRRRTPAGGASTAAANAAPAATSAAAAPASRRDRRLGPGLAPPRDPVAPGDHSGHGHRVPVAGDPDRPTGRAGGPRRAARSGLAERARSGPAVAQAAPGATA